MLLLERIEEDGSGRTPASPRHASRERRPGNCFLSDRWQLPRGSPPAIRRTTNTFGRSRLCPSPRGAIAPAAPTWGRPTCRPASFQLIWLYGPAGRFRPSRSGASSSRRRLRFLQTSRAIPFSSAPPILRPIRLRSCPGPAAHGGVGCRGRGRARRDRLSQPACMASRCFLPLPVQAGVVFCFAFAALLASQFLSGRRALRGVIAIAAAYGATPLLCLSLRDFGCRCRFP